MPLSQELNQGFVKTTGDESGNLSTTQELRDQVTEGWTDPSVKEGQHLWQQTIVWQKGCTSADPADLDVISKFRDICVPQNCIWQADKHSLCSILYCGLKSSYRRPAERAAAARKCWTDAEAAERSRSNWSCPTGHQRPRWSHCQVSNEFIYPIQVRKFKLSRLHVLYF